MAKFHIIKQFIRNEQITIEAESVKDAEEQLYYTSPLAKDVSFITNIIVTRD